MKKKTKENWLKVGRVAIAIAVKIPLTLIFKNVIVLNIVDTIVKILDNELNK